VWTSGRCLHRAEKVDRNQSGILPALHMTRVLTVLEAHIPPERQDDLKAAYHEAVVDSPPPGLVRSMLVQDINDRMLWRIETLWESREAEPVPAVLDVVEELTPGT
jgi:hypothetical protein